MQILSIQAECSLSPDCDGFSLQASLNQFATAEASYHIGSGGTVRPILSTQLLGQGVELNRIARTADRTNFSMRVGAGGESLAFSGILAGGGGGASTNNYTTTARAVHTSAQLTGINLGVYSVIDPRPIYAIKGSILQRMRAITKLLIEQGSELLEKVQDTVGSKVHSANQRVISRWFSVLGNSSVDCGALDSVTQPELSASINMFILSVLKTPTSNFLEVILSLGSAFRFQYAPSLTSGNGRLVGAIALTSGSDTSLAADPIGVNFDAQAAGLLAPGAVCITNLPGGLIQAAGTEAQARYGGLGLVYPENGDPPLLHASAPGWVPRMVFGEAPPSPAPKTRQVASLLEERLTEEQQKWRKAADQILDAIKAYARLYWLDVSRGTGTITFSTPFRPGLSVGTSVSVSLEGSAVRGTVCQVRHDVSSSPQSPRASTVFTLSHIS